jgi:hypothetical protein
MSGTHMPDAIWHTNSFGNEKIDVFAILKKGTKKRESHVKKKKGRNEK